jgi:hypothetical protein
MCPATRMAYFFPVTTTPLAMRAGLHPFGEDFGNGDRDRDFFLIDDDAPRYRAAKAGVTDDRHATVDDTPAHHGVHRAVLSFVRERLAAEHDLALPALDDLDDDTPMAARYRALQDGVQEDFAVLHRGPDDDGDTIALSVCFPSGWRPERLRGASFQGIHVPVPGFAKNPAAARSMVQAMVERGPYVRFVWTISADDHLDHHPDHGRRLAWDGATRGFLRLERQVTVPFPNVGGSLFLIRTYLRPFGTLSGQERQTLHEAVAVMPDDIAAYKGLLAGRDRILALLSDP